MVDTQLVEHLATQQFISTRDLQQLKTQFIRLLVQSREDFHFFIPWLFLTYRKFVRTLKPLYLVQ